MQTAGVDSTIAEPTAGGSKGENQVQVRSDFEVSISEEDDEGWLR